MGLFDLFTRYGWKLGISVQGKLSNNLIDPDVQKRLMENLVNYTHDNNLEDVSLKPLKAKLFSGIIMVINVC